MDMEQVKRIAEMESFLDESAEALAKLEAALDAYEAVEDKFYNLNSYYGNGLWMADFEDDEAGRLPADLKRGVLAEDTVYDLLCQHRDLIRRMQKAVLRSRG